MRGDELKEFLISSLSCFVFALVVCRKSEEIMLYFYFHFELISE